MPEEVASSFTELQIEMIEHTLEGGKWPDHPVDVRLSIPVLWRRFYFLLLAGPERRSAERRKYERARRPVRAIADMILVALFFRASGAGGRRLRSPRLHGLDRLGKIAT